MHIEHLLRVFFPFRFLNFLKFGFFLELVGGGSSDGESSDEDSESDDEDSDNNAQGEYKVVVLESLQLHHR